MWSLPCSLLLFLYKLYIKVSRGITLTLLWRPRLRKPGPVSRVAIIGGGFAGALSARLLASNRNVHVVLYDDKEYFEYVPAILKAMVYPDTSSTILIPWAETDLPSMGVMVRTQHVTSIDLDTGTVFTSDDTHDSFDYLILTSGSLYAEKVVKQWSATDVSARKTSLCNELARMENAEEIVLCGGGTVGVELAAEIASRFWKSSPAKSITLISPRPLLQVHQPKAGRLAEKWLTKHGVTVIIGDRVMNVVPAGDQEEGSTKSQVELKSGKTLECSVYYKCVGVTPTCPALATPPTKSNQISTTPTEHEPTPLSSLPLKPPKTLGEASAPPEPVPTNGASQIVTTPYLQVADHGNVFVAGDLATVPQIAHSCSGRTAFLAEITARLAAGNLLEVIKAVNKKEKQNRKSQKNVPNTSDNANVVPTTAGNGNSTTASTALLNRGPRGRSSEDGSTCSSEDDKEEGKIEVPMLPCSWVKGVHQFPGTRAGRLPSIEVVSLGSWNAVLCFNKLVFGGPLAAMIKAVVEYSKFDQLRGGLFGSVLWWAMDEFSPWLGRLIPVYDPHGGAPRAGQVV